MSLLTDPRLDGPTPRPEPKRDRWGRYLITHPHTGKSQSWTRATTFASSVADTFGLTKWQVRMAAIGLAQRPDLFAQVASSIPLDISNPTKDEKARLEKVCEAAKEHAGTSQGANQGTALHSFCEAADLGRTVPTGPWSPDVAAYRAVMEAAGIGIDANYVERIVTVPEFDVAGTFDRLVVSQSGKHRVADLKTGKDLSYSWGEIAIQLALYAHAETIYDPATGEHEPMPEVDQEQALVMWLPVSKATCTLYLVDIAAGWEMAQTCAAVREWRKRKNLATVVPVAAQLSAGGVPPSNGTNGMSDPQPTTAATAPADAGLPADPVHISETLPAVIATIPDDPFAGLPDEADHPRPVEVHDPDRIKYLRRRAGLDERIDVLKATPGGLEQLQALWPRGVPTLKQFTEHTAAQLTRIDDAVAAAETALKVPHEPFPDVEPAPHVLNTDPRVVGLIERLTMLPADIVAAYIASAREAKVPQLRTGYLTEDHLPDAERLVAVAEADWMPRAKRITEALQVVQESKGVSEAAMLAALGVREPKDICGDRLLHLDWLADTILAGVIVERDGRLVVDLPAQVMENHGGRKGVLDAARAAAKANGWPSPASADVALANPLLAAALTAV